MSLTFQGLLLLSLFCGSVLASEPDWSEGRIIPREGLSNPFQLSQQEEVEARRRGLIHAQIYPVEITGMLPPYRATKNLIEGSEGGAFRHWISKVIRDIAAVKNFEDLEIKMGLSPYPQETDTGVYSVPYPEGHRPSHRMGLSLIERDGALGFTASCAACHASQLFGKTVMGMTNRFPMANEFFLQGKRAISVTPAGLFKGLSGASDKEIQLFRSTQRNVAFIKIKKPLVLGLDTSLAQVALSLNLREDDPWAEKTLESSQNPRADWLDRHPADSKPAVWWNVKYKNRWLSDGSIVSGNPIFTNILWNELGRGIDLKDLNNWLVKNYEIIKDIAVAVFNSEAPRYTDFFPAESIDLARAQQGEKIFNQRCSRCHGVYEKNWSFVDDSADLVLKLGTRRVLYHEKTPVVNVGTDPHRAQGMKSLEALNELQLSKNFGILIRPQNGYVPPPLVGIWARWPYFHNNSVPSLCAVLTAAAQRPKVYWARPAEHPQRDFDSSCNGYPLSLPAGLKKAEFFYDTGRVGLGNKGHDEGIFLSGGREILSSDDKRNLILYLQTL